MARRRRVHVSRKQYILEANSSTHTVEIMKKPHKINPMHATTRVADGPNLRHGRVFERRRSGSGERVIFQVTHWSLILGVMSAQVTLWRHTGMQCPSVARLVDKPFVRGDHAQVLLDLCTSRLMVCRGERSPRSNTALARTLLSREGCWLLTTLRPFSKPRLRLWIRLQALFSRLNTLSCQNNSGAKLEPGA